MKRTEQTHTHGLDTARKRAATSKGRGHVEKPAHLITYKTQGFENQTSKDLTLKILGFISKQSGSRRNPLRYQSRRATAVFIIELGSY